VPDTAGEALRYASCRSAPRRPPRGDHVPATESEFPDDDWIIDDDNGGEYVRADDANPDTFAYVT